MRKTTLPLSITVIFTVAATLIAGAAEFELSKEAQGKLNPKARIAYEKGINDIDHVNFEGALNYFIAAKDLSPEHKDIRFLVGKLAFQVGKNETKGSPNSMCLCPKSRDALGENARKLYDQGVISLDHINPEGALEFFTEAKNLSPENRDIHILVGNLESFLAKKHKSDLAIVQLKKAETAYNEVLGLSKARMFEKKFASTKLKQLKKRIESQPKRLARRAEIGKRLYAEKLKREEEMRKKAAIAAARQAEIRRTQAQQRGTGGGGFGGRGGGGYDDEG